MSYIIYIYASTFKWVPNGSVTGCQFTIAFPFQDDPSIDEFLRMALGAIIARSNEFQPLNIAPWNVEGWINPPGCPGWNMMVYSPSFTTQQPAKKERDKFTQLIFRKVGAVDTSHDLLGFACVPGKYCV